MEIITKMHHKVNFIHCNP